MKKHPFTLTELLTVIAIIAVLAGIATPVLVIARQRGQRTSCMSNQGQTMKLLLTAKDKAGDMLHSGNGSPSVNAAVASGDMWSAYLFKKDYIQSLGVVRCPTLMYTTPDKTVDNTSITQAYGVVFTDKNDGKFDFRGTKLLRYTDGSNKYNIGANALMIGACATTNAQWAATNLLFNNTSVTGKVAPVHRKTANFFFYDGHVESVVRSVDGVYYPAQTSATEGKAVKFTASDSNWQKI